MGNYLTFDVGTTAIKTCVFNQDLKKIDSSTDEYDLITVESMVELEPETYWNTISGALRKIASRTDLSEIKTICITTQGETMIPVTRDGEALNRAVVWLDGRAEKEANSIIHTLKRMAVSEERHGERSGLDLLFEVTGVPEMNGLVPLAKFLWFKDNKEEVYQKAYKFLLLEDYLIFRLTGQFVSEKSLLTSTAWFDIRNDCYWEKIICELGLDKEKLPKPVECGDIIGNIRKEIAIELGLPETVQVVAGAMDQITAAIGGGGLNEGVVTATIGTAMVMTASVPPEKAFSDSGVVVYRGYKKGQFVLIPMTNTAGVVFKWLKDTAFLKDAQEAKATGESIYDQLCEMASAVPAGANGVTLIPYFQGSVRPQYVPDAKGVFFGLGLDSGREVLIRATLEGIGYMIRENLEMLSYYGVNVKTIRFFGGGSKNRIWNQIISDVSFVELVKPEEEECGSLGAAILSSVAIGDKRSVEDVQDCNPVAMTIEPDISKKQVYDAAYRRYTKVFDVFSRFLWNVETSKSEKL